jgi:hypothetical protein
MVPHQPNGSASPDLTDPRLPDEALQSGRDVGGACPWRRPCAGGTRPTTRLLEFIRSQPEGTFAGQPRARRRLRLDTYGHDPEHTAAIKAWRARLPT